MDNYNYPMGSDNSLAPWNEELPVDKDYEVTVSIVLNKTFNMRIPTYEDEKLTKEDLLEFIQGSAYFPQDLPDFVEAMFKEDLDLKAAGMPLYLKKAVASSKGWTLENIEVDV